MIYPRSVRDVAVLLVNTVARLAERAVMSFPNLTDEETDR